MTRMRQAQRTLDVVRQAIGQSVENGANIDYSIGVVIASSGYHCSAYLNASAYASEYIRFQSGQFVSAGDYILVGQQGVDSWVDQILPYSLFSKMVIDYENARIGVGTDGTWDFGDDGQVLTSGGPSGAVRWDDGGAGGGPHDHEGDDLIPNSIITAGDLVVGDDLIVNDELRFGTSNADYEYAIGRGDEGPYHIWAYGLDGSTLGGGKFDVYGQNRTIGILSSGESVAAQLPVVTERNVVVIRALGGGADDVPQIQAAVDAATPGTTIYMPDDKYEFKSKSSSYSYCIGINTHNIHFEGRSHGLPSEGIDDGTLGTGSTAIVASGSASGGSLFQWYADRGTNTTDDSDVIVGGGIKNMSLYGGTSAYYGLELQGGTFELDFENITIYHVARAGIIGGTGVTHSGSVHGWHAPANHRFKNVNVHTYGSSYGWHFYGNPNVAGGEDSYGWVIDGGMVFTSDGDCVRAEDCDDMSLRDVGLLPTGTGKSLHVMSATSTKSGGGGRNVIWSGARGAVDRIQVDGPGTGLGPSRMNIVSNAVTEDRTGAPTFSGTGGHIWFNDDQGRYNWRRDLRIATPALVDEFMRGGNSSSAIGDLGWYLNNGTAAYVDAETGHPGIRRFSTTGTISTLCTLSLIGSGTEGVLKPDGSFIVEYIFRLTQVDTDTMFRIGLGQSYTGDPPSNGIYVEKLYADTNLYALCRSGGSQSSRVSLGALAAGTWYHLTIRRRNTADIGFHLGDVSNWSDTAKITTNVPTAALNPIMQMRNQTAVAKTFDVDAFQLFDNGLAR
jgi:hypothetical protein